MRTADPIRPFFVLRFTFAQFAAGCNSVAVTRKFAFLMIPVPLFAMPFDLRHFDTTNVLVARSSRDPGLPLLMELALTSNSLETTCTSYE